MDDPTSRALDADRHARARLGVRLGHVEARAEYWKARALLAERDLRLTSRRLETLQRRHR